MNYDKQADTDRCAAEAVSQHQGVTIAETIMWSYFTTGDQHTVSKEEGTFSL